MRSIFVLAIIGNMASGVVLAQSAPPQTMEAGAAIPGTSAARPVVLPILSGVTVTLNDEIDSRRAKVGQMFAVTVSRDVVIGSYIIIPRGTAGVGEITSVIRKGGFGKSAKLELDLRSLTLQGGPLPISGHFRLEGRDNDTTMIGAVAAVGVFSGFVTGHSAIVSPGREFQGFTRASLPLNWR